jgi:DNA polymerase III subunit epsilon
VIFRWPWSRPATVAKHPILYQNEQLFEGFDQNKPIEEYDFVSFDTELTGLNPRRDVIISIGAVRIRNLQIVAGENFFSYVLPRRDLPKDSTLIHRITPEQLEHAPDAETVLPEFVDYCNASLLVGHYVALDMAFLNKAMKNAMGGTMKNPCVDSMRLAQTYQEHRRQSRQGRFNVSISYGLAELAREFRLPTFVQHDALEDALQTAYLFVMLVKKLQAAGYVTLRDFYIAGKIGPSIFA